MPRKPVLNRKQYMDILKMLKEVIVTVTEYVGTRHADEKEKAAKFEAYKDSLDTFVDYMRYLAEDREPVIQPPSADK